MKFRNETCRRIRLWPMIIGAGVLIGPPINYIIVEPTMGSLLRGVLDGAIIAGLVGGYTQFVRDQLFRRYFHRLNFTVSLPLNAFIYFVLFHLGRLFSVMSRSPEEVTGGPAEFLLDTQVLTVIPIFFALAVMVEFILQMNRHIGHNVLWYFVTGTYHRPKEEDRIFMFLDLRDYTKCAELIETNASTAPVRNSLQCESLRPRHTQIPKPSKQR
jgi:adenylate cyclase